MAAAVAQEASAPRQAAGPHQQGPVKRGRCGCGSDVLIVRLEGQRVVTLELEEVLPPMPCPLCRMILTRGQNPGPWCWRCGGTRMVGEPLPEPGVALGPDGAARVFSGRRRTGEAVHRLHLHQ